MQPNNINDTKDGISEALDGMPKTTPVNPGGDVVFKDKRSNKGMIIGMVILAILAVGGIGFGVWAYLSGNQKEAELKDKIAGLENQSTDLVQEDGEDDEAENGDGVKFGFLSSDADGLSNSTTMTVSSVTFTNIDFDLTLDGAVTATYQGVNWDSFNPDITQKKRDNDDLTNQISGRVVDIATGHIGNGAFGIVLFLMEDGSVVYMQEEDILSQKYNAMVVAGTGNAVNLYGNLHDQDCAGFVQDREGALQRIVVDGFSEDGLTVNLKLE